MRRKSELVSDSNKELVSLDGHPQMSDHFLCPDNGLLEVSDSRSSLFFQVRQTAVDDDVVELVCSTVRILKFSEHGERLKMQSKREIILWIPPPPYYTIPPFCDSTRTYSS